MKKAEAAVFSSLYAFKASDSLHGGIAAIAVVAHDASDEAHITCRNPVMVVQIHGSQ